MDLAVEQCGRARRANPSFMVTVKPPIVGDVRVVLATSACSLAGTLAERHAVPGGLVAFAGQCALSNAGALPVAHAVYDFAWSGALPMSLALAVLASTSMPTAPSENGLVQPDAEPEGAYAGVGAAFAIASIGSIVGVTVAFALATHSAPGSPRHLSRALAAQVGGAVLATYVGGSANFAQVVERVRLPSSIVGALAACDIATMGLYFAMMNVLSRSERARRWVEGGERSAKLAARITAPIVPASPLPTRRRARAAGGALAAGCALLAVLAGRSVDVFAGSSTLAAVGAASALGIVCARLLPSSLSRAAQLAAGQLAPLFLNFFYAAVGASARPSEVAAAGSGATLFLGTALGLHILVVGIAGLLLNRLPARLRPLGRPLQLSELLIGSNAAIGGPSTAAAFAAPLGPQFVVPAAVWGIVGYGVGTSLGVGLWSALR